MEAFFSGVRTNDVYIFKAKSGNTQLVGVAKKTNGNTAVVFFHKGDGGLIHPKDGAATCTIDAAQSKIKVRTSEFVIRETPKKVTDADDLEELANIWGNVNDFVAESECLRLVLLVSLTVTIPESMSKLDAVRSVVKDKF